MALREPKEGANEFLLLVPRYGSALIPIGQI